MKLSEFVVKPDAKHLLSLFSRDIAVKTFRFQPQLTIIISFNEYRKLCSDLVEVKVPALSYSLDNYSLALKQDSGVLIRYFYGDMSNIVMCELMQSLKEGKEPTKLCHTFDDENLPLTEDLYESLKMLERDVLKNALKWFNNYVSVDILDRQDYIGETAKYAVLLRALAVNSYTQKVEVIQGG